MKVVLAVALLALLAIGVDATAQRLGALPANSLALTSSDIFTASGFTITLTKNQGAAANYVGDGTAILETKFNVTWTGYLPPTATGVLGAIISFSGAGGVYQQDSSCTGGLYGVGGTLYGNFLSFESSISPRFLAAGTATATVSLYYPPSVVAATASFTFPVITPFVPATGNRPTISAFTLASTFTGVNAVVANVTLANQGTGINTVSLVFTASNNNQGVAWVTSAATTNGVIGNDAASWTTLAPFIGSWCGDSFSGFPASGIDFALGTMLSVRSVSVSNVAGSTSYGAAASFLTGNNAIAVAGGDTDVTPPTCQGAAFATPTDVATAAVPITKALVLACSDNMGGSGLEYTGAFLRAQSGSITYDFASENFNTANEINVPLHYSGSVNVIGVWSMDGAGNTVVYGSCGNALTTGAPESVCGEGGEGSSSSAVIASISVVIACILAVLAL